MADALLRTGALIAARRFLERAARPLELARFRHHFEGGPAAHVLEALAEYQNRDGGFGRALEPDLRTPESSALCTTIAFQVLRSIGVGSDEPLAAKGIAYLAATLDRERGHWRIIPASAEESPHAPWWNQTDREESLKEFSLNPTAEILGILFESAELVSDELLTGIADRVMSELGEAESLRMHELLCCLRLLQTQALPRYVREPLHQRLTRHVAERVECDSARWGEYGLRPLQVADRPDSPFLSGLEAEVAANLDYEIAAQGEDGSWTPNWSWGDAFPDIWGEAKVEWSGILTVERLLFLDRFGRIEG